MSDVCLFFNELNIMNFRTEEIPKLSRIAKKIETLSEKTHASNFMIFHAEEIFNKFCLHLLSAELIVKNWDEKYVDISSLAAIARMIVEAHNGVKYFLDRRISADESEFRLWLYCLHHQSEMVRIFDKFSFDGDHSIAASFRLSRRTSKDCLSKTDLFKNLPGSEQKNLMKGHKAFYRGDKHPASPPFDQSIEKAIFRLLSSYIHSFPIGNSMYRNKLSTNPLSFSTSFFLIIETIVAYAAATIYFYSAVRWKLAKRLSKSEKNYLMTQATQKYIDEWKTEENRKGTHWF